MKKTGWVWEIYKLLFLDIWHRRFFNLPIQTLQPQSADFSLKEKEEYLKQLNLYISCLDEKNHQIDKLPTSPTLFYGDHPSSLDAMFVYFALFGRKLWFVSFLYNQLHFKFLKNRTVPVASRFAAQKITPLGMKMKLSSRLENLDEKMAREMNLQVPEVVADKIFKKEDVVIFPSGGWGKWQDGIGFALDLIYEKNPNFNLNLQPIKIVSFREIHSVLHGWAQFFGFKVGGVIKIRFGQNKTLTEMGKQSFMKLKDRKQRAKAIRAWLEEDYRQL